MKRISLFQAFIWSAIAVFAQSGPDANTVVLTAEGVKNLRIETVTAEESTFEETFFALGRIEARPDRIGAVSSRISGRVVELAATVGDVVKRDQPVIKVESRQPGSPPPTVPYLAPIAGVVTRVDVRLGDPVEPDRALMEIIDLSEVFAVARVPEADAARMKPGATAHITITAVPGERVTGEFIRFSTSADMASGTIDALFRIANPNGLLRPGMRAEFAVVTARREGVVSVPRSAVQGDPSNRFVYVTHFELPNAFVKSPVVVGQVSNEKAEILSGLFPADEVVTRGAYSLAFAGGGSLSLKEALDAAHGHEHNADGSEITADQKKASGSATGAGHDDHGHEHGEGSSDGFWKWISAILFVLLIAVAAWKRSAPAAVKSANPKAAPDA